MSSERIRGDLTEEQIERIKYKLDDLGFSVDRRRYIHVKKVKDGHPRVDGILLSVGYIGRNLEGPERYFVERTNTDMVFPEDYHATLTSVVNFVANSLV